VNFDKFKTYCLSMPGVTETYPMKGEVVWMKVSGEDIRHDQCPNNENGWRDGLAISFHQFVMRPRTRSRLAEKIFRHHARLASK